MNKEPPSQGKGSKNRSTKKYQENYDGVFRAPLFTQDNVNKLFNSLRKMKIL